MVSFRGMVFPQPARERKAAAQEACPASRVTEPQHRQFKHALIHCRRKLVQTVVSE